MGLLRVTVPVYVDNNRPANQTFKYIGECFDAKLHHELFSYPVIRIIKHQKTKYDEK